MKNYLEKENLLLKQDIAFADSICGYYRQMQCKQDSVIGYMDMKIRYAEEYSTGLENLLQNYIKEYKRKSRKRIVGVGVGGIFLGVIVGALLK